MAAEQKKILICHRGALGDFVLTWPALAALRHSLPGYCFVGIGRPAYQRLAVRLGLLDSFHDAEAAWLLDLFSGHFLPAALGQPTGAILWLADGAAAATLLRQTASLPVVIVPPMPAGQLHAADHHERAIRAHFPCNQPPGVLPQFVLPPTRQGDYGLIHPGSGSPAKNYPPAFYGRAAHLLRQAGCGEVGLILGPAEGQGCPSAGRAMDGGSPADGECGAAESAVDWLARPTDVEELAGLLAGARIYIGNDSGVSHLAGILGVPTIAFYKSTDPAIWGVVGRHALCPVAAGEKLALETLGRLLLHWQRHGDLPPELAGS